jgi:hypothetical protein
MKQMLFLDFDGVILRSNVANKKIANRASLYTWKQLMKHPNQGAYGSYTKDHFCSIKDAENVCANLYKSYGHTLLGLKAIGCESATLTEYNSYIYDDIDYTELTKHNNDMDVLYKVIDYCHAKNITPYIFTNSPKQWVASMLREHSNIIDDLPDVRNILKIDDTDDAFLKPGNRIYDSIENGFTDGHLFFVDDNACNFKVTLDRGRWTNMLYTTLYKKLNKNMYLINDISQVSQVMKTN